MAGMLTAYLLAEARESEGVSIKKIALLEKGKIGEGVTSLTTAFLTESLNTSYVDLIKDFGLRSAKEIVGSHQKGIDIIESIVRQHSIECDFTRCANYVYAANEKQAKDLEEEYEALLKCGGKAVLVKGNAGGDSLGIPHFGYIKILHQAKFHPLRFLDALTRILLKKGIEFHEKTGVKKIKYVKNVKNEEETQVYLEKGMSVFAKQAIVTTYEPFNKPLKLYFEKGTYTSYVYELKMNDPNLEEGTYEDMDNPYHYFRYEKDGTVLVGGEDHRSDIHVHPTRNFNALKKYIDEVFKNKKYEIVRKWKGPILEPVDGLALIGPLKEGNTLYATAFSGNGMTYSAIAATIIRDIVYRRKNPWIKLYAADRALSFRALMTKGKDYAEEFIKGAVKNVLTESKTPDKGTELGRR